jgi:hypothetical protein
MDNMLTETCTHKNNPTGTALATVATGIACTPIDPLSQSQDWKQSFPIEKQFLLRQSFTKYTAFLSGDYLVADSVTYAVKVAQSYDAQGGMDAYYHLLLEKQSGS